MNHQETYRHNEAYADFLSGWDTRFYAKYADALKPKSAGTRVLDVGCGVGQVLARFGPSTYEAFGVDVSESNIQRARQICPRCQVYDGRHLPFTDSYFASAGALNVLEHVEQPEAFIAELARVIEPGGRLVLSSPNFYRVIGWRDYHPHMRGLRNKCLNARRLWSKWRQIKAQPDRVRFDRLTPIQRQPFQPDDDAIIATNPLEISFFLRQAGCRILKVSCTDRYVFPPLDWLLNCTPLRFVMLNVFVQAEKSHETSR